MAKNKGKGPNAPSPHQLDARGKVILISVVGANTTLITIGAIVACAAKPEHAAQIWTIVSPTITGLTTTLLALWIPNRRANTR